VVRGLAGGVRRLRVVVVLVVVVVVIGQGVWRAVAVEHVLERLGRPLLVPADGHPDPRRVERPPGRALGPHRDA
jgi:hypothetical protein